MFKPTRCNKRAFSFLSNARGPQMAMPTLDPVRFPFVKLGNLEHKLPMPGTSMVFPREGRRVDSHDPFWRMLIADRSLVVFDEKLEVKADEPAAAPVVKAGEPKPVAEAPFSAAPAPDPEPAPAAAPPVSRFAKSAVAPAKAADPE
jgi:hypothetical protein